MAALRARTLRQGRARAHEYMADVEEGVLVPLPWAAFCLSSIFLTRSAFAILGTRDRQTHLHTSDRRPPFSWGLALLSFDGSGMLLSA